MAHPITDQRLRALLASLLALALGLGTLPFTATAAQAKDLSDVFTNWSENNDGQDPITIDIEAGDDPIHQYQYVDVTAHWDLTGMSPQSGDTFTLGLPPQFTADVETFELTTPDGDVLGSCSIEPKQGDANGSVTCTLTNQEYLDAHRNIHGWLTMSMQATQQTDESIVEFETPSEFLPVPLPGDGGIVGPNIDDKPIEIEKTGWFNSERTEAHWRIYVPGDRIDTDVLEVVDPIPPGLTFDRGRVVAVDNTQQGWEDYILTGGTALLDDAYSLDYNGTTVTVTVPDPDPTLLYVLEIDTTIDDPDLVEDGTAFTNTATVNGTDVRHTATVRSRGSGGGEGYVNGFSITKDVSGDAADAVTDAEFTVDYTYDTPGPSEPQIGEPLRIGIGETDGVAPLPHGTQVVLSEVNVPAIDGIEWGTPQFTGAGVTDHLDGTATLTVLRDETIAVSLTNIAAPAQEPSPTPTETPTMPAPSPTHPTPEPTDSPSSPAPTQTEPGHDSPPDDDHSPDGPATPPPDDDDLPLTGLQGGITSLALALVLLTVGALALWTARRQRA